MSIEIEDGPYHKARVCDKCNVSLNSEAEVCHKCGDEKELRHVVGRMKYTAKKWFGFAYDNQSTFEVKE